MRITLKDISRESGISICSVSQILNNKPKAALLTPETHRKVRETAERLGYCRDELARAMATGRTNVVAVVMPDCEYGMPILSGIADEAAQYGLSIKLISGPFDKLDIVSALREALSHRVVGLIVCGFRMEFMPELRRFQKTTKVPAVITKADNVSEDFSNVATDQIEGVRLAMEHLLQLGHRKIFCIGEEGYYHTIRKDEYTRIMEHAGLVPRVFGDNCYDEVCAANPDAVFCSHDGYAHKLLIHLYRKRLFVPDIFSVVGFGDLNSSGLTVPPLTTVHEPYYEVGVELLRCVHRQLDGYLAVENIKLPIELVIRETTAPAGKSMATNKSFLKK